MKSHPQIAPRIEKRLQTIFSEMAEIDPIDSILPILLHPQRQAERGFNQAEVIALALSRATDVRLNLTSLERVRATHLTAPDSMPSSETQLAGRVSRACAAPHRRTGGAPHRRCDDDDRHRARSGGGLMRRRAKSVSVLTLARVAYAPRNRRLSLDD